MEETPHYVHAQHRGNVGEGQLWVTKSNIEDFNQYEVSVRKILDKIAEKGKHRR